MGQFGDADAGPGARPPGKKRILHAPEHRHVPGQVDVERRQLDHVLEGAR